MSRPINFTDTTVIKKPYVEIDGVEYEVQDGTYEGGTDLNANTFNKMQDELNSFRNLLNIPDGTYTHNGVTYISKNGVLTYSSGTSTGDVNIGINITPFTLKSGTYTMSNNSGNYYPYIFLYSGDTRVVGSDYADNGVKTFTIENETTINKVHLYFGRSTPPASVKPQVEEGTAKTSYTPWAGYIVESGSNDNGSYIKYSDGTMICTKKVKGTIDITKTWYTLYTGSLNLGSSPQTFITTPVVNYSMIGEYAFLGGSLSAKPTIDNLGSIMLIRPSSQSNTSYEIDIVAIGRWK